jgi:uncharacterized protein (DUF2062 family)
MTTDQNNLPPSDGPRASFFRRRVVVPLLKVLGQGHTPEKVALSLALGVALGLFPIFGTTTLLCLLAGVALRLNHPALQVANQLMYPVQIPLILVFVRLGEYVAGRAVVAAVPVATASAAGPWAAMARVGTAGLHGILGWAVVAPLVAALAYAVALPMVRLLLRGRAGSPLSA